MIWLRTMMVSVLMLGVSAAVSAQQAERPVIRLGMPTPLGSEIKPSTFVPLPSAIQPASYGQPLRPAVVRGALPSLDDDEPKQLVLPKDLPLLDDPKQIWPTVPAPVQPVQGVEDKAPLLDLGTHGKLTVIADSAPPEKATGQEVPIIGADHEPILMWETGDGQPPRIYAQGEWLLWWTRGMHLPPLVTTDSPNVPLANRGILGNGTSQLLYGDNTTSAGPTSGGRFTLGYSLDPCGWCVFEGTFFFLGGKNDNASFNSNQFPILARPFFDLNNGVPRSEVTTSPLQPGAPFAATGSIRVDTSSTLLGAEANLRSLLWCGCDYKITGLVGFRYLDLSDHLGITENFVALTSTTFPPPDASIRVGDLGTVFDRFDTRNHFYGGQIGIGGDRQSGRWNVEGNLKLAVGVTQQAVDIDGGQRIFSPSDGRVQSFAGGLYALPSNIGLHTQSRIGFVPEVGIKLGYDLTDHVRLFVGYDFLYWSSVLRPGDQIDQGLNLLQVPNSGRPNFPPAVARPIVPFQTSSYWAQGINAGILIRY